MGSVVREKSPARHSDPRTGSGRGIPARAGCGQPTTQKLSGFACFRTRESESDMRRYVPRPLSGAALQRGSQFLQEFTAGHPFDVA